MTSSIPGILAQIIKGATPKQKKDLLSALIDLPPLENAMRTQIPNTLPTYLKARPFLEDGKTGIDFGAGLGLGAKRLGFKSYEPLPQKSFKPDFTDARDIPSNYFDMLTNLNVLNVVPRPIRDDIVENIGRVMSPGGRGVITTRGKDVMDVKNPRMGPEPMSVITGRDTYQKGFTQKELRDYLNFILGNNFEVESINLGPAGARIRKRR